MSDFKLAHRDLSWLSFNDRLLDEASKDRLPLMERIKFLSIYSSNLDEFYRVRIPALLALQKIKKKERNPVREAGFMINTQLIRFGKILNEQIVPALRDRGYHFITRGDIDPALHGACAHYFFTQVAAFMQPVLLKPSSDFFPENNELYLAVILRNAPNDEILYFLKVPNNALPRFIRIDRDGKRWILFLEDVIRLQLELIFPGREIAGAYNIKITRDAELNLEADYGEDMAEKIEKQLQKRDLGFATRLLYEPGFPLRHLHFLVELFNLGQASVTEGGHHHNLKDLMNLPVKDKELEYPDWPPVHSFSGDEETLFQRIGRADLMVHTPYHSYDAILRFFNEAAIDPAVEEISTTLYRVASDSRIGQALITAAKNSKKVFVLVELKARFDEANNIRWTKRMKAAGVKIMHSSTRLKVHAKIALVKRRHASLPYAGLLATGNLNETTARFYTDHILLTTNQSMLEEMDRLFEILSRKKKADGKPGSSFKILLVAQFNLQSALIAMIDREIAFAKEGKEARITIKVNNLEEPGLIKKLYQASEAGVSIRLIVRSICRLIPGLPGQSENIRVIRIVDRYLEHGRLFIFHNDGLQDLFLGSADWMTRNLFHRVEVCFPVTDETIRKELLQLIRIQLEDNVQAVRISSDLTNEPVINELPAVRSQEAIYEFLRSRS